MCVYVCMLPPTLDQYLYLARCVAITTFSMCFKPTLVLALSLFLLLLLLQYG